MTLVSPLWRFASLSPQPNPLYQATLGLAQCYERVGSRRGQPTPRHGWWQRSEDFLYTSEDGLLRLGPHLPLFMARCAAFSLRTALGWFHVRKIGVVSFGLTDGGGGGGVAGTASWV